MKNFITNNWKKIIIFIGGIFILINIITKLAVDKTLLQDYIKYGKDIESPGIIENVGEVVDSTVSTTETPFSSDIMKLILLVVGLILLVIIISSLGDSVAAKAKEKAKKK